MNSQNEQLLQQVQVIEQKIVKMLAAGADAIELLAHEPAVSIMDPGLAGATPMVVGQTGIEASTRDASALEDEFQLKYQEYLANLNDIQVGLRLVFRQLAELGILSSTVSNVASVGGDLKPLPYRGSVEGDEKDLDNLAELVVLLRDALAMSLQRIGSAV